MGNRRPDISTILLTPLSLLLAENYPKWFVWPRVRRERRRDEMRRSNGQRQR